MKSRARISVKTVAALALGLGITASVAGGAYVLMRPRIGGDRGTSLSMPNPGSVRVVTTPIENSAEMLHYKWSLIGSSNWRKATGSGTEFALSDTYPLNSATENGGCHVYETDLLADKSSGKWTVTLHGSDGTTITTEGELPAGVALRDGVQIAQTASSANVGTPNDLLLARIAGVPLRLSVAR